MVRVVYHNIGQISMIYVLLAIDALGARGLQDVTTGGDFRPGNKEHFKFLAGGIRILAPNVIAKPLVRSFNPC